MDERIQKLVAIGASVAVNCQPCLSHHLAECDRLGIGREEVKEAVEVGISVSRGAAAKTSAHAQTMLGIKAAKNGGAGGCGCG